MKKTKSRINPEPVLKTNINKKKQHSATVKRSN